MPHEFTALDATGRRWEDGGAAVYMLRWVNTRGEKGPWSEICSATVAALEIIVHHRGTENTENPSRVKRARPFPTYRLSRALA